MTTLFKNLFVAFTALLLIAGVSACVDQDFDEPPTGGEDPGITANATIADLKDIYTPGTLTEIKDDLIVKGVVVADDRAGNFFRSFILQDETGGIEVRINQTNAYNFYPVGREIFIRCQGLIIGDFNGVIQLGGYVFIEDGVSELGDIVALEDHLIRGLRVGEPEPEVKSIGELNPGDISKLIRLENVEFASQDVGLSYADALGRQTLNRTILDCNGNEITLRTSGFATFASEPIPGGNGSITGIYSVFGDIKQFYIRDLTDVNLTEPRCGDDVGGGGATGNEELVSIQSVRDIFDSGTTSGPDNSKITGVVISDVNNDNWAGRNLVIQDETAGIVVRFSANHNFELGEEIEVVVSGQELSEFNGLMQVNNVPNNLATSLGSGTLPTPRQATVAEILNNSEAWESTLVEISGATIQGGGTYAGAKTVSDGTGSITMFTRSAASFSGASVPSGEVTITAVVSQFNDPQITIRNTDDVISGSNNGGGDGGGGTMQGDTLTTLMEDFSDETSDEDLEISGWTNVALTGSRRWRGESFSGNTFAQATAFQDTEPAMETWLITPPIDLSEDKVLSFRSAQAFFAHNGLSVWISTDFDGENVNSATWTELPATLAGSNDDRYAWVNSGDVDLSAYAGVAYIGFKYEGSGSQNTTTYRIDDVEIRNN
jgi:DNA/RNA endonuclease YhcR with UshA esterase domain